MRRGKYKYDVYCFNDFIKAVKGDLNLNDALIHIRFKPLIRYHGLHSVKRDNTHIIVIDVRMNKDDIAKAIMHELRHAYQWEKGIMSGDAYIRVWKGTEYSIVSGLHDYTAYSKQPWETDANKYAKKYKKFIRLVKENNYDTY